MISVIMPVYNVAEYIGEAINSVLGQTYKDIELIIVLDKPMDGTEDIVRSYNDRRIKIIENDINIGVGASRAKALAVASGEYVITADGDDYYDTDVFEKMIKAAEENDADIVSTGITTLNEDGSYVAEGEKFGIFEGRDTLLHQWKNGKVVWVCNKLIRKHLYDIYPYCTRRFVEDTPMIVRQLWHANKLVVLDNVGYYHRMVPTSICHTLTNERSVISKALCWCELVEFFMENDHAILKGTNLLPQASPVLDSINSLAGNYGEEKDGYLELMSKIMRIIKITNVDFRESVTNIINGGE